MKDRYEGTEIEIVEVNAEDIIITSGEEPMPALWSCLWYESTIGRADSESHSAAEI